MPIPVRTVLWQVDLQRDFMLPGGALYVQGAERLLPNIRRLVDLARNRRAFLISSACQHAPNDPEFSEFPPHCLRGTPGADLLPEARAGQLYTIPNDHAFVLPGDLWQSEQVLFEKQNINVFTNPHVGATVDSLPRDTEFIVFGVVTEYCVQMAANGLLDPVLHKLTVEAMVNRWTDDDSRWDLLPVTADGLLTIPLREAWPFAGATPVADTGDSRG